MLAQGNNDHMMLKQGNTEKCRRYKNPKSKNTKKYHGKQTMERQNKNTLALLRLE